MPPPAKNFLTPEQGEQVTASSKRERATPRQRKNFNYSALTEKTGIELSSSQVRRILKRKKYSYIWAKYSLESKQNPIERSLFQERLTKYLAVAREYRELLQVWFWERAFGKEDSVPKRRVDESGFSLRVIRP